MNSIFYFHLLFHLLFHPINNLTVGKEKFTDSTITIVADWIWIGFGWKNENNNTAHRYT